MRYLTLSADYLTPRIVDQHADAPSENVTGLSADLLALINAWNDDYQEIIAAGEQRTAGLMKNIDSLDDRGLALADQIAAQMAPAKVTYYSDARGRIVYRRTSFHTAGTHER